MLPARQQILEKNGQAVYLKNTYVPDGTYLMAVEQFHLASALIEIIAKRHAVPPFLDFTAFRPQLDVDGVTCL